MKLQEKYMNRCLELAKNAFPACMPNPAVGAVLVVDGRIVAEGFTSAFGGPHAEVNAINAIKDQSVFTKIASGEATATLYVSLEPCSHYGKTPPCADLIVAKKIKNVVIGAVDPFAKVAGQGIKKLLEAGCNVKVGILEEECQALNKRFFCFHKNKRPYIILKWAQTQDGFIAPGPGMRSKKEPVWITNPSSRQLTHKWRTEEMAILVGTHTALADNPGLTAREWKGKNPLRIVIDKKGVIPLGNALFDNKAPTLVFTEKKLSYPKNVEVEILDFGESLLPRLCDVLYGRDIQSLIVEGGSTTLQRFIDQNLWDEARVFTGQTRFGKGIKAPEIDGETSHQEYIDTDLLQLLRPFSKKNILEIIGH